MTVAVPQVEDRLLDVAGLRALVDRLWAEGYEVLGPQVVDGVIAHDVLPSIDELPQGWTDDQAPGRYRLVPRSDGARFGYAVGPRSWKEALLEPREPVWTMRRDDDGELSITMHEPEPVRRAFVGVRPCELAAIGTQDRVLVGGPHPDPAYETARRDLLIVTVDCGDPAATCFCASMGTGPAAGPGFDIALTELVGADPAGSDSRFLARSGTGRGHEILAAVPSTAAGPGARAEAQRIVERAAAALERRLDTDDIRGVVYEQLESPHWDRIAERCLSCGNCTLACPTCFCTDLRDVTDLGGGRAERWRVWDTCFSTEFSHLGPGPVRASTASRYRQWFVHKLASWIDQYGESGCVGCGRCITWCPVGIDLTEELAAMRAGVR